MRAHWRSIRISLSMLLNHASKPFFSRKTYQFFRVHRSNKNLSRRICQGKIAHLCGALETAFPPFCLWKIINLTSMQIILKMYQPISIQKFCHANHRLYDKTIIRLSLHIKYNLAVINMYYINKIFMPSESRYTNLNYDSVPTVLVESAWI